MSAENMSYCRFGNTAKDIDDCLDHWDDSLPDDEQKAKEIVINLAKAILSTEGYEINGD